MSRIVEQHISCPVCPSTDAYRERNRRYFQRNKERIRLRNRLRHHADPMLQAFRNAKMRARLKGWEFNISKQDIIVPEYCPVFKTKIEVGCGKRLPNSPSLDRIDNSKGYIKGNVRVISLRANRLKNDMTINECKLLLEDLECLK